ncbi:hypothetical protein [Thermogutta sp.]|uniref:hypothetical protein n=1 Tax=Thermogutta sp. TaxID=1962930 RepID=UPI00321F96C3
MSADEKLTIVLRGTEFSIPLKPTIGILRQLAKTDSLQFPAVSTDNSPRETFELLVKAADFVGAVINRDPNWIDACEPAEVFSAFWKIVKKWQETGFFQRLVPSQEPPPTSGSGSGTPSPGSPEPTGGA